MSKFFDITGQKFGKLTAVEFDHKDESGRPWWKFNCDCGNSVVRHAWRVMHGEHNSCSRKCSIGYEDFTGRKYGRLTVRCLDHIKKTEVGGRYFWLCDCECGKTKITLSTFLKKGLTVSCGCIRTYRLEKGESGLKECYYNYSKVQKKRFNQDLEISLEDFKRLTSSDCYYCGCKPYQFIMSESEHSKYVYNGLDRIDSSKPYSLENVVPCCGWCNRMKDDHTQQELIDHMKRILAHLKV